MHWILLIILVIVLGQLVYYSLVYGIAPTPTSSKVKQKIFQHLPQGLDGHILELGSGWGSLAIPLALNYPNSKILAYEISPLPYLISKVTAQCLCGDNLVILRQDFLQASFKDAMLIVCYLYPGAMSCLKDKFEQELQPGAYVISHTFAVPGWEPLLVDEASDLYLTPIYLYQCKKQS